MSPFRWNSRRSSSSSCAPAAFRRVTLLLLLATALGLPARPVAGQDPQVTWKTGVAFADALAAPAGLRWEGMPLRRGLHNLARAHEVCLFLDRRVDPDQLIDGTVDAESLESLLRQLAESRDLQVAVLDSVVYLGPADTAGCLAALSVAKRQEMRRRSATLSRRLQQTDEWQWEQLTTPRGLLAELAALGEFELVNLESVPHDLWPSQQLPPLSLADRMTLVLAGFHMTFELSGTDELALVPIDGDVEQQVSLPRVSGTEFRRVREALPDVSLSRQSDGLLVRGPLPQVQQVMDLLRRPPGTRPTGAAGETGYTLTVEDAAAGDVLRAIVSDARLTLELDPDAAPALRDRVEVRVVNVSLEELLEKTLGPVGLSFRLEGTVLTVTPQ